MNEELRSAIYATSERLGVEPMHLATAMSYETGGTFDPWKKGPTTQWGQHRGLIQWGEPQREKYGVYQGMPVADQVAAAGEYLYDHGVRPGMGLLDIYSAINAGGVGRYDASDENNGGAPGTVRDKVNFQMEGHKRNAEQLLGGSYPGEITTSPGEPPTELAMITTQPADSALGMDWGDAPIEYRFDAMTPEELDPNDPGNIQLALDAYNTENSASALTRARPELTIDPDYELTEEKVKSYLGDDLDAQIYADWFSDARSEKMALAIREQALTHMAQTQRLDEAGWKGLGLRVAAAMADPAAIAAGAATGGIATVALKGRKAWRLGKIASTMLIGGVSGAGGEAATIPFVPEKDHKDVLAAGLFGAGIGGVVGALLKNPNAVEEAVQFQRIQKRALDDANLSETPARRSVGAAQGVRDDTFLDGGDPLSKIQDDEVGRTFLGGIRWDTTARLRSSKNPVVRMLGEKLAKDAADPGAFTATEDMQLFFDGFSQDYFTTYQPALKQWFKDKGLSGYMRRGQQAAADEFHEQVGKYVVDRRIGAENNYHKSVVQLGNKVRDLQSHIRELAQNPMLREGLEARSVQGFEELADNPYYLMRVWDEGKIVRAKKTFGDEGIESALEAAMAKANPDVPTRIRKEVAKAFRKSITMRAESVDDSAARILGSDDLDEIVTILKEDGGLSAENAEALMKKYRKKDDTKASPRGKKRLFIDESVEVEIPRRDGTGTERMTIQDMLLNQDANFLMGRYIRQMAGRIALARMKLHDPKTGEVLLDGVTNDLEWDQFMRRTLRKGADDGQIKGKREADRKNLDFLYNFLVGRPVFQMDQGKAGDFFRMMEKFNYTRIMNQVGVAQIPEIAAPISSLGLKAVATHLPAFRRAINSSGEEVLENGLARDLETFMAYGTDRLTNMDYQRIDDGMGDPFSEKAGNLFQRAEQGFNKLSRVTSDISGMNHINMALQRLSMTGVAQKFVDMAHGSMKLSKARMKALGLSDEMTERVFKELRDPNNVETVKGALTGKKLKRMHFERWTDKEAREAFRQASFRMTRQMVQTNDIGMMNRWLSHPVARIFTQFRRFMLGSWTNNLLYNVNLARQGDMRALSFFLLSTMMSGLTYSAWRQIGSIGRADRDEYLEKELSWGNLARAAFERSGYSSIIPMLIDTGASAIGKGPYFAYRSSGQAQSVLLGNPTVSFMDDVVDASAGITRPWLEDREYTASEVKDFARLLPFQNALPISILLNTLTQDMEQYPPRDY